jgi:hypothetical protein
VLETCPSVPNNNLPRTSKSSRKEWGSEYSIFGKFHSNNPVVTNPLPRSPF